MKKTLVISGMMCAHCQKSVKDALSAVFGVSDVTVDLTEKKAVVDCDASVTEETLVSAIEQIGFAVEKID